MRDWGFGSSSVKNLWNRGLKSGSMGTGDLEVVV